MLRQPGPMVDRLIGLSEFDSNLQAEFAKASDDGS
jgi:hypothetical protein